MIRGLESTMLNSEVRNKLNALQRRMFRKVLNEETTLVDPTKTNECLLREVNRKLQEEEKPHCRKHNKIGAITECHDEQRTRLVMAFDPNTLKPYHYGKKREGRPRFEWYQITTQELWDEDKNRRDIPIYSGEFGLDIEAHRNS